MGNKSFKTVFESAEERGFAKGFERGFARGLALVVLISHSVRTTTSTDAKIAEELGVDEETVKAIRQDFAVQQLG